MSALSLEECESVWDSLRLEKECKDWELQHALAVLWDNHVTSQKSWSGLVYPATMAVLMSPPLSTAQDAYWVDLAQQAERSLLLYMPLG